VRSIHEEVIGLLVLTMGPAAKPFLERQCKFHLGKPAANLTKADIPLLAKWVEIGVGLALGEEVGAKVGARLRAMA
jgi:hypothetical protein